MESIGVIGGILGILVALGTLAAFYVSRLKDAESRGAFLQEFKQLKLDVDKHEGRISVIIVAQEEMKRGFLEQTLMLKQIAEKVDSLALDMKELVTDHNRRRSE